MPQPEQLLLGPVPLRVKLEMDMANDNNGGGAGTTLLAVIVGGVLVIVVALFAFGGGSLPFFGHRTASISITTPAAPH